MGFGSYAACWEILLLLRLELLPLLHRLYLARFWCLIHRLCRYAPAIQALFFLLREEEEKTRAENTLRRAETTRCGTSLQRCTRRRAFCAATLRHLRRRTPSAARGAPAYASALRPLRMRAAACPSPRSLLAAGSSRGPENARRGRTGGGAVRATCLPRALPATLHSSLRRACARERDSILDIYFPFLQHLPYFRFFACCSSDSGVRLLRDFLLPLPPGRAAQRKENAGAWNAAPRKTCAACSSYRGIARAHAALLPFAPLWTIPPFAAVSGVCVRGYLTTGL